MTTFDRFDPFERRIGAAMDDIVGTRQLDYLDDVFRQTARTAQRPGWSFPERWFNVDTTLARPVLPGRRVPYRSLIALVVLAALLATAAFYIGTQKRLPPPYGPADNGQLIYGMNGDLYVQDAVTSQPRLLLGGHGEQSGVVVSPNGLLFAYDNYADVPDGGDPLQWVANIDGSNPRQVLDVPYTFEWFEWGPDSQSIAIVTRPSLLPQLWIAPADGSGARQLTFDSFLAWGVTWDPLRPGVLLVRGEDLETHLTDLYYVTTDGAVLEQLGKTPLNLNGPEWELSGMTFTPDGQTIAYNEIVAEELPVNRFRVHLMNRDGSNARAIAAPLETGYSQAWPLFSPDGTLVLMDSWETKPGNVSVFQLAIAPTDGSAPARRIGPILDDGNMIKTWSPDGSRIILCGCEHRELYSIDPISGASEKLPWQSDLPGWQRVVK
jgi:Tol biopolymer transport system component